jgi:ferritin-like metal-binding protein YciE
MIMKNSINRTGIQASIADFEKMQESIKRQMPVVTEKSLSPDEYRREFLEMDEEVGSLPPKRNMAKKSSSASGPIMDVFLDKLGERLAFERSGVRLYQAFLAKCKFKDAGFPNLSVSMLEQILEEEEKHFVMLKETIEELGGDPTAVTPSADLVGVMNTGIMQVITDPRTTVQQSLEALLNVELIDNACWESLVQLADLIGNKQLAERFEAALEEEEDHLAAIQGWVMNNTLGKAQ